MVVVGDGKPVFIAGPCVIEGEEFTLRCAEKLKKISEKYDIKLIFKASYDKANRTSIKSFRGPGLERGLEILAKVKREVGLPVVSDVHCKDEVKPAAEVLDVIQIPAFLSRQTDLVVSSAKTGKPIHVKKGQFMSPWDVRWIAEKIQFAGNNKIMFCERGTFFGYGNLVVDMRSLVVMREWGFVIFDSTHSVQRPSASDGVSGGMKEFVPYLARAAAAVGVDGFFFEVHPEPEKALSDSATSIDFQTFEKIIQDILKIWDALGGPPPHPKLSPFEVG